MQPTRASLQTCGLENTGSDANILPSDTNLTACTSEKKQSFTGYLFFVTSVSLQAILCNIHRLQSVP
jgi:hypothetical protein